MYTYQVLDFVVCFLVLTSKFGVCISLRTKNLHLTCFVKQNELLAACATALKYYLVLKYKLYTRASPRGNSSRRSRTDDAGVLIAVRSLCVRLTLEPYNIHVLDFIVSFLVPYLGRVQTESKIKNRNNDKQGADWSLFKTRSPSFLGSEKIID